MKDDKKVKKYFEVSARDFDEIYDWMSGDHNKPLKKIINQIFRKGMVERFNLTIEECEPNKTILDIGCGSGRISLTLAEKGAKVIGIDYSSEMIDLAHQYLKIYENKYNSKLNVKFFYSNFMENFNYKEIFDITLAIGVFDYIEDPIPFLTKMKDFTKEMMIATFPAKNCFQMPIRKLWLWSKKCPVYFYTTKKIVSIYKSIKIKNYEIIKIPAGFLIKAFL